MLRFWKKSQEEKLAEQGDKSSILKLIEQGKKDKAIRILENFKENPELRPILFRLYMEEGKYYYAYQLVEHYDRNLATAKERAFLYEKVGEKEKAVEEYARIGDWESLWKAGLLLKDMGMYERSLEFLERAYKITPIAKREDLQKDIQEVKTALGLEEKPKESLLDKIRRSLRKTKEVLELKVLFAGRKVDDQLLEELEERLVKADIGVKTVAKLVEDLRKDAIRLNIKTWEELEPLLKEKVYTLIKDCRGDLKEGRVYLFLGVNGSGKTTTIGKLAFLLRQRGKKVLLCAADTFRSAAIEQLEVWAERSGAHIVKHREGADPAAVVFDAMKVAQEQGYDVVLVDTAGRLHTKEPLIRELRKIKQTIQRFFPEEPSETLLVLDATVGQNSISQAKVFKEALDITGIVLTKLDSSSKGGAVVAICQDLKIPVKLVGLGEGIDDLQPFDPKVFVEELLS
ncbi:signal recognition particle-docking protein FtsY [Thermocrinis albus DSM 14484]|uniref:Signal recognition particle receptor FtsY n=1 Tax=Thermocrinis albus (strain DSM 14484 / JCM 11386 / HI 11/12) TaxID=638303 RepID=D3SQ00_THEAH|nr:signal recognition particle-docking protein FtsY [Thermocrinis albus]ADC89237.1 signal recognition particle-docking protein FtsY [Thermocrinis albus DSM 14484]